MGEKAGEVKIELTLKVKGVTVKLGVEEAKGLYEALKALVGEKNQWVTNYTYPIYTYPMAPWYPTPGVVYCSNDNAVSLSVGKT